MPRDRHGARGEQVFHPSLHVRRLTQTSELGEWVTIPTTYAGGAKRIVTSGTGQQVN